MASDGDGDQVHRAGDALEGGGELWTGRLAPDHQPPARCERPQAGAQEVRRVHAPVVVVDQEAGAVVDVEEDRVPGAVHLIDDVTVDQLRPRVGGDASQLFCEPLACPADQRIGEFDDPDALRARVQQACGGVAKTQPADQHPSGRGTGSVGEGELRGDLRGVHGEHAVHHQFVDVVAAAQHDFTHRCVGASDDHGPILPNDSGWGRAIAGGYGRVRVSPRLSPDPRRR